MMPNRLTSFFASAFLMLSAAAHAQSTTTIHGRVVDANGKPVSILVSFNGLGIGDQGYVATAADGSYSTQIPAASQYIVSLAVAPAVWTSANYFPTGYLPERKLIVPTSSDVQVNFTAQAAGTLWLKGYDAGGHLMTYREFPSPYQVGAYPPGVFPYGKSIEAMTGSLPLYYGWINSDSTQNTTCLLLPSGQPAAIWALWRLPVVGTTFLHADNSGNGFVTQTATLQPLNLVYEFAATENRDLQSRYNSAVTAGHSFSTQVSSFVSQASTTFVSAQAAQQAGNEVAAAVASYTVLVAVVQAREQMVLEEAQRDIDRVRKSDVTVTVVDQSGRPLANASVNYQQRAHDFIFSIGWPQTQQDATFRQAGFESAIVEAWWGEVETSDGVFSFPDADVTALANAGLQTAMHASVWTSNAYQFAFPAYARALAPSGLVPKVFRYSNQIASHFAGKLSIYNAFNEPDLPQAFSYGLPDLLNVVSASARGARQANSSLPAYANIGTPVFSSTNFDPIYYQVSYDLYGKALPVTSYPSPAASGLDFVQELAASGSDVNTTGIEMYYGVVSPPIDLSLFADTMQLYGSAGNPLFLSELSYATLDDYPTVNPYWKAFGGWHQGYTDQAQADWARDTFLVAFSKPYIRGVEWVAADDGPPNYDFVGDALYHSDFKTTRPALTAIQNIIGSWTTTGTGTTDANGQLTFRGFGGTYNFSLVDATGKAVQIQRHVNEGKATTITLTTSTTSAFALSASSVQLSCRVHGALPTQTMNVENTAGGALAWTATADSSWIVLSPSTGNAPTKFTVSANCDSLAPGSYAGNVTLTAPAAAQQRIPVSLTVQPTLWSAGAASLSFSSQIGTIPQTQTVLLSSNGSGQAFSAKSDSPWLLVQQSGNSTPANLVVSVNPSALSPGSYSGKISIVASDTANNVLTIPVSLTLRGIVPQTGWWWDPQLNGTGFFIEYGGKSGVGMFVGGFLYDASGNSTWLVSTGPMTGSTYTSTWLNVSSGQTLLGPYKAPTVDVAGNLSITFTDSTHAVLTRPDGTQVNIQRFSFTSVPIPASVAGAPLSGWWWAGSTLSGTGYGIEVQGSNVFIVAYVYDNSGNPVWYLSTGTLAAPPNSYGSNWDVYAGGPQLTSPEGTYSAHKVSSASRMTLTFTDPTHGTLTMGSVTIPIVRFQEF